MSDENSPQGAESETTPLSISEAANAYAGATTTKEPDEGQPEDDFAPDGDEADDELLSAVDGEDEGDPADDDQADDGEDDDSSDDVESNQGRFVSDNAKVRLSDGTVTTIAELKSGSLKNADYTQKTQALATEREAVTVQSQRNKQYEQQLTEQAAYVADLVRSIVPDAPDPELLKTDPMAYISQEASHKQWMAHLNYLDQQKQLASEASKAETTKTTQERAQKEWASLVEKVPALKDEKRAASYFADIEAIAKAEGYTIAEVQAEISQDHRKAVILRKAALWDKLQANKSKVAAKVEGRPPVQKGGARLDPTRARARDTRVAMDRLNTTGSVKDGVAALLALEAKG